MGSGNKLQRQKKGSCSLGERKAKVVCLGKEEGGKAWVCSPREQCLRRGWGKALGCVCEREREGWKEGINFYLLVNCSANFMPFYVFMLYTHSKGSSLHFSLTGIMLSVSFTCLSGQGSCVCGTKMRFGVIAQIVLGAGNWVRGPGCLLRPGRPHFRY